MIRLGGVAQAQQPGLDDSAQARWLFDQGMAHFQLEEWDPAIEKWEAGFRLKPVPEFLYNIAQAYRLSKRPEKAISFYQKYLRMAPKTPNRAEVERHIATLKTVVESQGTARARCSCAINTTRARTRWPDRPSAASTSRRGRCRPI
jgi:tetratricopeptide (TPR) repeat protein